MRTQCAFAPPAAHNLTGPACARAMCTGEGKGVIHDSAWAKLMEPVRWPKWALLWNYKLPAPGQALHVLMSRATDKVRLAYAH